MPRVRAKGARRLVATVTVVLGLFAPVLTAAAGECRSGADCVGTDGPDKLYGTSGKDRLFGKAGDDLLAGRASPDSLFGGGGNDRLNGHNGADYLYGGSGADLVIARDQPDKQGGIIDWLYGGRGADELRSDSENDQMSGGPGDDALYGTAWPEGLVGGPGDDRLAGGGSRDSYRLDYGGGVDWGHDVIVDDSERSNLLNLSSVRKKPLDVRVNLNASPNRAEVELVGGGASVNWSGNAIRAVWDGWGDDTVRGSALPNRIFLHGGLDRVFSKGGDDFVLANDQDEGDKDRIDCGAGYDTVGHYPEDEVAANCERTYLLP